MNKTEFKLEPLLPNVFTGYLSEQNWNGWVCPFFERSEALKIMEAQNRISKDSAYYDEAADAFVFKTDDEDEKYFAEQIEGKTLYAIGNGIWIWEEAE